LQIGGVVGATAQTVDGVGSGIVLGLGLAAFSAGLAMFCLEENRAQKDFSATTWVAAILTFTLGAYALVGDMRAAAGLAVAASLILALREPLHAWVEKLTWPELAVCTCAILNFWSISSRLDWAMLGETLG
jgi:uncharacterized membrane protein (DUF4010 family)